MPSSQDLKKAAIEQSLLDVDYQIKDALEVAAIGRYDDAVGLYKQALATLEERYRGDIAKIPVDVLVRRYRVLLFAARSYAGIEHYKQAIQSAIEANALSAGPLADFQELYLQSSIELGDYYLRTNDINAARDIITKAAKAPRGDDVAYGQAIVSLGTGRLLVALRKPDLAIRAVAGGLEALKDPDGVEKICLRADLLLLLGSAHRKMQKEDSYKEALRNASLLLYDAANSATLDNRNLDAVILFAKGRPVFQELDQTEENVIRRIENDIRLASLMNLRGRWEEADKLFRAVVSLIQQTGVKYTKGYVLARAGVGNFQMQMKQYDQAQGLLENAVKEAERAGEIFALCTAYYYLGLTFSKRGADDKGIELFEEALDRLKELQSDQETNQLKTLINNQLGFIEMKRRRYDAALDYFQRGTALLKDTPADIALGESYRLMGDLHTERGQSVQGERALKKALDICEKAGATYEAARVYKSLGINLLNGGDLDKAAFFLDESIEILEKLGIEAELPMAYSSRARVCIMKEEYQEAEALFTKDFNIAKKTENKHSLAFSYYHLGRIRRLLTRTHSAEDFLHRSLDLFSQVNNQNMCGHVMIELALCASARKDVKSATDLCAKAQTIFEARRNSPDLAELLLARGVILREAKRQQMARRCFEDCMRIHERQNQPTLEAANAHYEFALFWREQNDRKEATEQIVAAIGIAEKLGLGKKMNHYRALLNEIDPETGAKMQLSRFMDKATVEQISKAKSGDALTVERKNLTLLFTDIRSFTTISETLALDDLTSFLNDFYTNVTQVVIKFRGLINKFIGDEVMAIFNLDGTMNDHPAQAVRAAVDLVRTMNEINLIRNKRGEMGINIGVGVNTGEVLVGNFGSSVRQEFTAIGDTVNTAARLQGQAGPGEIVVSQSVYEQVRDIVIAEDMGEKPLKGKGQPIRLWKIKELKE